MKYTTAILGAAVGANAHYFFDVSVLDGVASSSFQYIRSFTRPTAYNPIKFSSNPPEDIRDNSLADGEDIICNQGAFAAAGQTDVLTVDAGAEVTVKLGVNAKMEHPGPGLVYMSRAPSDDVKTYDGTGDWFKIFQEGVCNTAADFTKDAWCTWGRDTMTATIPADTPAGEYLMRFEHIGVHRSHVNQPEHYVSCVQVKVENGGTGTPGPVVQFPGAYTDADDYANFSIYNGLKDFPFPGPAVWEGGSSGSAPAPPASDDDNQETETPETPETETPETPETETPETPESEAPETPETETPETETPCQETPSDDSSADDAPAEDPPAATCAGIFAQCGGKNWDGPTCCSAGSCRVSNDWYSQCV